MADSKENIRRLENIVKEMDVEIQMIHNRIESFNEELKAIQKSKQAIYQIVVDNKPINPQKIKPYLDDLAKQSYELNQLSLPVDKMKDNLSDTERQLKRLRQYFYNQYMVTVENEQRSKKRR